MDKTIYAVRIKLAKLTTERPDIGLYTNSSTNLSEFRWSEQPVTDTSTVWKSGIIAEDGIGDSTMSADFVSGGNVADFDGYNITVVNTAQIGNSVSFVYNLSGCTCQLYKFSGNEGALDNGVDPVPLRTDICEVPTWNDRVLTIPVKSAAYRRNGNIATVINNGYVDTLQDLVEDTENSYGVNYPYADDDMNGKIVPCTFGTINKAKLLKTASAELPFTVNGTVPSLLPVELQTTVANCSSDSSGKLTFPAGNTFNVGQYIQYNNKFYAVSEINGNVLTFSGSFPVSLSNVTIITSCCYETMLTPTSETIQYKLCYSTKTLDYGDIKAFPVVARDDTFYKWYTVQISSVAGQLLKSTDTGSTWTQQTNGTTDPITGIKMSLFNNRYLKQVSGDGSGGRIIDSAKIANSDCKTLNITIKNVFETNLAASATAAGTWVELADIRRAFSAEHEWQCKSLGESS